MRARTVILGILLLARAGVASADCGDGLPDAGEQCDDGNTVGGDCCSAGCLFEPIGSACADDGNLCTFDACNGAGECLHPAGHLDVVCRPQAGPCDVEETCNGVDAACPPDVKSSAACRPATGDCDVTEGCDGVSDDCPADAVKPASAECRAAVGVCDVAEDCDGVGRDCPADAVMPATVECRPVAGVCDIAERCDGLGHGCPADAVKPPGIECRAATGACDVVELCNGLTGDCPEDGGRADGTPCNDGNRCTRADVCQSGSCTGTPLMCAPLDTCHVVGTCDPDTGACSAPPKADNAACDDRNACTTADSCQTGVCRGLTVTGCCVADAECADASACTEDRCTANACVHLPRDDRCGAPAECGRAVCAPDDGTRDASGCVMRTVDESTYCTEDDDPCTIDACHTGFCEHDPDGSGPRCPMLVAPFRTTLGLLGRARLLQTALDAAGGGGCTTNIGAAACDVTAGQDAMRLVALLQATETDLQTTALAISGRLAGSSSPDTPRDPTVRARLAVGLLASTPGDVRAFLATLRQARTRGVIGAQVARTQRSEATRLLRGTVKLRGQLNRIVIRRRSFAR